MFVRLLRKKNFGTIIYIRIMRMNKILIVEDNEKMNGVLCSHLNKNGFRATGCLNPDNAYMLMEQSQFDMIISDIMMPHVDGFEFAESIRAVNANIPILFISSLDDFSSKQKGFNSGIDDYMVKPVDLDEVVLRVNALLRRAKINASNELRVGNVVLVKDEMAVYADGKDLGVMPREFLILYKLLSYPKKIFTRSELVDEYWGAEGDSGLRTVDVYITKLRKIFAGCDSFEIVTVHGFGYKAVIK